MRSNQRDQQLWVDDGPLPDLTSGMMWLATGAGGLLMLLLPGTGDNLHVGVALVLAAFAIGWGGFSLYLGHAQKTMSIQLRAAVTAAMMPVVALALWATGGSASFLQPLLLFTALFVSYFFPPRLAWPLIGLFVFAFATPLSYDHLAVHRGYIKVINDVWGHPVGDEVLRIVAGASESVIREGDCLARIGGDEFALLAPGAAPGGVPRLVDALDEAIRDADVPVGVGPIRATFGWAVAPGDTSDATELFRLADNHLIERKRAIKSLEFGLRES